MPQPNAARVALFKDFLTPENKHLLVPREEKVANFVVEGKTYVEIADYFKVTVPRIIQIADRVVRIIKRSKRDAQLEVELEERFKKLPQMLPENVNLVDYLDGQLAGTLKRQGVDTGAKLLEAFDTDALGGIGPERMKKISEFLSAMDPSHAQHIIWFEDAFQSTPKRYVTIGPFPSWKAANQWLEQNGFEQERRPGFWLKTSESTFNPQGGVVLTVPKLQAQVESLKTLAQVRFVSGQ
jgi:hypothetical protein